MKYKMKRWGRKNKVRNRMTENLLYVTRVEPVVYEMFKPQDEEREMKAERGEKRKKGEKILST
jgi:hypothetical protein